MRGTDQNPMSCPRFPKATALLLCLLAAGATLHSARGAAAPAAPPSAPPAAGPLSYGERSPRQQSFAVEYVEAHRPAKPPATPAELDRYLAAMERAWAKSLDRPDPVLARFDPYVPFVAVMSLMGSGQGSWALCHTWAHHMVPRFLADFEVVRAGPTAERAGLVWPSNAGNVLGSQSATTCDLPRAEWDRLYAAAIALPKILDTYLARRAYADDHGRQRLAAVRDRLIDRRPTLDLEDALRRRDAARARPLVSGGLSRGEERVEVADLGHELAALEAGRGRAAEALAVLDEVARSTTPVEVPGEKLQSWYAEVDAARGAERYARAAATRLPILAPTGQRLELAGRYVDLATGRPLDLASLAGKTVLLDFWATWCGPCLAEVPRLNALAEKHGRDRGFVLVGVSSDFLVEGATEKAVADTVRAKGMKYLNIYDRPQDSFTKRLRLYAWPSHFLLDGDGALLAPPKSGRNTVSLEEVEAYLAAHPPARPAPPPHR